jgi:hypothetical protein
VVMPMIIGINLLHYLSLQHIRPLIFVLSNDRFVFTNLACAVLLVESG